MGVEEYSSLLQRLDEIQSTLDKVLHQKQKLPEQEWFSIEAAAALTGLSTDHVRRHVTSGLLPASNLGTFDKPYYRIHRRDIDEWMMKRRETAIPAKRKKAGTYVSRHHK